MSDEVDTSVDSVQALNAALAKAQGAFPPITQNRTVTVRTKTGGQYTFSYATLDQILGLCRPALAKNGLAITQLLEHNEQGRPCLRTELRHQDGGTLGSAFPLPSIPDSPQELGSMLTYLRRYAITALIGVATEEDDDGNHAAGNTTTPAAAEPEPPTAEPLMSQEQRRKMFALFDQSEFVERSARLAWTNAMLGPGRTITSSSELTESEADKIIRILARRVSERRTVDEPEIPFGEFPEGY